MIKNNNRGFGTNSYKPNGDSYLEVQPTGPIIEHLMQSESKVIYFYSI